MTRLSSIPENTTGALLCDIDGAVCRDPDKDASVGTGLPPGLPGLPGLPVVARLPINHCNLPAAILGGLSFQRAPAPLAIDGVAALHRPLFELLDEIEEAAERAQRFVGYMDSHFRLSHPEDVGLGDTPVKSRAKATYLRVVRGWAFDPDGREAAVLKGWVESRFGLLPRHHGESLREPGSVAWQRYVAMRAAGLYGTNALESQLDLLYAFCQYELSREFPQRTHIRLYRGVNRLADHEVIAMQEAQGGAETRSCDKVVLLNNVSSFSRSRERAGEFGDDVLGVDVPLPKIAFFSELLPGMLKAEAEYVVIGGLYRVRLTTL